MNIQREMLRWLSIVSLIMLGACGGGGSGSPPVVIPPPPATEDVSAVGVITALGSVTVNGVQYTTDATTVTTNGQPASFSDLKLGQIVALEGTVQVDGPRGTAEDIDYVATVIGPVENIDATLSQLIVMGQTVLTDGDTEFDPSIDASSFAGLTVGSNAQISGFLNANGEVVATRIEPDTASTDVQLIGSVVGLDLDSMSFTVNRLTVDYSSAILIDLLGSMPADGLFVLMTGALTNGILVVDEIQSLYETEGSAPGERAQTQGSITRYNSATDFDVNGFPVTTNASTAFANGTIADLQASAQITIDGEFAASGDSILANEITFGRVIDPTTTVTFDFNNFTDISVLSIFNVTVTQGPDFSVEVTIDEDIVDNLIVTQTGSRLSLDLQFGDNNAQTLDAVITLPVLNSIDVDGVATVTLKDFNQTHMTINVGNVSQLRGNSLMIGDLTARVSGVSQLDFGDIRPLGNANIEVRGISKATVNMDVGTTLTGSVMGTSGLFYYGTDVTLNVTTDFISSVTKLGETRP